MDLFTATARRTECRWPCCSEPLRTAWGGDVGISARILTQGDASQAFPFMAHRISDTIYLPPGGEERRGRLMRPRKGPRGGVAATRLGPTGGKLRLTRAVGKEITPGTCVGFLHAAIQQPAVRPSSPMLGGSGSQKLTARPDAAVCVRRAGGGWGWGAPSQLRSQAMKTDGHPGVLTRVHVHPLHSQDSSANAWRRVLLHRGPTF